MGPLWYTVVQEPLTEEFAMRAYALAVAVLCSLVSTAEAGEYLQRIFGWKPGDACIIKNNKGGVAPSFESAAQEVNRGDCERVIVDGPCLSSCTYFANLVQPRKVCVTRWARLGFHIGPPRTYRYHVIATRETGTTTFGYAPPYSGAVAEWLRARGGLTKEWKVMSARDAARIWGWCPGASHG
jgi:hypothetical protein